MCSPIGDCHFFISKRGELLSVALILFVFLALQLHAIRGGNYAGQDYQRHIAAMRDSAKDPLGALTAPLEVGMATPTAYHNMGGGVYSILGEGGAWKVMAIINVIWNICALLLFYLFIRRVVRSFLLRVSCMIFMTFLPVTVITSMVVASDAFMPLFFITAVWLLILIVDRLEKGRSAAGLMAWEGALLIVAFLVKNSFIFIFAGMAVIGIILHRYGILRGRQFLFAVFLIIVIPVTVFAMLWFGYLNKQTPMYLNRNIPRVFWNHVDSRSLLFLKKKDVHLLDAPFFHEKKFQDGRFFCPIQESGYYSYPALLHLGIFTDVLNIDQPIRYHSNDPGVIDEYYTRVRPQDNQNRMKFSVRSALVFSFSAFFAVFWWICVCLRAVGLRKDPQEIPVMILLVLGLSLFLGYTLTLPLTPFPYTQGGWLPRFTLSSILSFWTIFFVALDRLPLTRPQAVRWAILAMVIGQSLLHISFLWV